MAWKITDLDGTFSLLSVGAIMPQNPNSLCQLNLLNIPCRWRHPGKEQKRLQKDGGTERKFWDKCPDSFSFLSFLRDLLLLYTPSTTMARSWSVVAGPSNCLTMKFRLLLFLHNSSTRFHNLYNLKFKNKEGLLGFCLRFRKFLAKGRFSTICFFFCLFANTVNAVDGNRLVKQNDSVKHSADLSDELQLKHDT